MCLNILAFTPPIRTALLFINGDWNTSCRGRYGICYIRWADHPKFEIFFETIGCWYHCRSDYGRVKQMSCLRAEQLQLVQWCQKFYHHMPIPYPMNRSVVTLTKSQLLMEWTLFSYYQIWRANWRVWLAIILNFNILNKLYISRAAQLRRLIL